MSGSWDGEPRRGTTTVRVIAEALVFALGVLIIILALSVVDVR